MPAYFSHLFIIQCVGVLCHLSLYKRCEEPVLFHELIEGAAFRDCSFIEDKDGYRHIINRAFLTYVAIDEKGTPLPIPYGLEVNTTAEMARWDGAVLRRNNRKSRKDIGF